MYLRSGTYTGRVVTRAYGRSLAERTCKKPHGVRRQKLGIAVEEQENREENLDQIREINHNMAEEQRRAVDTRMKPATFSGYCSENARSFLERFSVFCQLNNIVDDAEKIGYYRLCVSGPCENWYSLLPDNQKDTWAHLEAAFRQRYVNPQNVWGAEQLLEDRKQKENEPVELFINDVQNMAYRLNKDEDGIRKQIVRGLLPKLKGHVISHNPATLEDTINQAKIAEMCEQMNTTNVSNPSTAVKACVEQAYVGKDGLLDIKEEIKAMGKEIKAQIVTEMKQAENFKRNGNPPRNYQNRGAQFTNGPQGGLNLRQPPPPQRQNQRVPYCTNCQSSGHTWQRCLANTRPRIQYRDIWDVVCYNCGLRGHMARNCRRGVNMQGYQQTRKQTRGQHLNY